MIKNYTSTVTVEKSIAYIEKKLTQFGVNHIIKKYGVDGDIKGIMFSLTVKGKELAFKLPAKVEICEEIFLKAIKKPQKNTINLIHEQAQRTAWKLVSDWIDIQLAMVELGQKELIEIFLSDIYDAKTEQTLFEKFMNEGRLLGEGGQDES